MTQFKKISLFEFPATDTLLCFTITIVHLHFLGCFYSFLGLHLLKKQPQKCQGAMVMVKQRERERARNPFLKILNSDDKKYPPKWH